MEDQRKYYQPLTPVNDNLLCKICNKIAINALECVQCESLYCESCVQVRKSKKNKCPEEECLGEFQTKQPHRLVKQELSQVQFQCINRQQGCKEELKINNVIQHAAICLYATEKCKCGWQGKRTDFKKHEKNCPLTATQSCPTCKEQILLSKFMKHNCVSDLKESLEKVSEKFFDYKESSEFAIKELKNQFSQQILELQDLKHHQAVLIAEQNELKGAVQKLFTLLQQQEQKSKQILELQERIPEYNLKESATLKCSQNHSLSFWLHPEGNERMKKCLRCQRVDVNCRYYCTACKIFLCLQCEQPEIINRQNTSMCPGRHRLQRKTGFRCAVCDRQSIQMARPGGVGCDECDFGLCFSCIDSRKYQGRTQECPIQ